MRTSPVVLRTFWEKMGIVIWKYSRTRLTFPWRVVSVCVQQCEAETGAQ